MQSKRCENYLIIDHDGPITQFADVVIETMKTHSELSPFVNIIPLQLWHIMQGLIEE